MKKKKIVILLYFILLATVLIFRFYYEADYFWHLKMGEYIFKFKCLPKECLYSWFAISNGLMFTLHEWLYEVIIYLCFLINKTYGALIYYSLFITIFVTLLFKTNVKVLLKKNLMLFIPFIALSVLSLASFSSPRPHIMSWSLLLITIYLCYDLYNNDSKKIYFLPLITIIWGNVHGGSSCLSYMIPGLFMVLSLFNLKIGKFTNDKLSKKKTISYLIIIILNISALLINPYTIEMILYPYVNMFDTVMKDSIVEWQHLSFNSFNGIVGYIFIAFNLFIFFKGKIKIRLIDISLFLVFSYLAISSQRFLALLVIVSFYTTLRYLNDNDKPFGNLLMITMSIIIISLSFLQINKLSKQINDIEISEELINTIKKEKPKRLFNDYYVGGYLIYNEIDVFIDGRADAYSKTNLLDYVDISGNKENTKNLLNKYKFDFFIVNKSKRINKYLDSHKEDYIFIIQDKNYCIYKRITSYK